MSNKVLCNASEATRAQIDGEAFYVVDANVEINHKTYILL